MEPPGRGGSAYPAIRPLAGSLASLTPPYRYGHRRFRGSPVIGPGRYAVVKVQGFYQYFLICAISRRSSAFSLSDTVGGLMMMVAILLSRFIFPPPRVVLIL